jgi:UDP-N-acetylmuramoyl-tripeptide--D-alanyl-D-alanine ligase
MTSLLAATPGFKRRILAAGEMRELGATSAELHREAGRFAAKTRAIDWVIGVAGDGAQIVEGAASEGVSRDHVKFFENSDDAAEFLARLVQRGDLLLVKGSRGVKMERVVEALLAKHGMTAEVSH